MLNTQIKFEHYMMIVPAIFIWQKMLGALDFVYQ